MRTLALIVMSAIIGALTASVIRHWEREDRGECPREIKHFRCRGDNCDHHPNTVYEAKQDMLKK